MLSRPQLTPGQTGQSILTRSSQLGKRRLATAEPLLAVWLFLLGDLLLLMASNRTQPILNFHIKFLLVPIWLSDKITNTAASLLLQIFSARQVSRCVNNINNIKFVFAWSVYHWGFVGTESNSLSPNLGKANFWCLTTKIHWFGQSASCRWFPFIF